MASHHYYTRRIRRLISTPAFQLLAICSCLIFGIRWVIKHNHDDDIMPGPVGRPMKRVDDPSIDWSKLYYVQYVTSPEYLCNALMVWSEIEEIGSRAQRLMLYPSSWDSNEIDESSPSQNLTHIARLLQSASRDYFVKLQPISILHQNGTTQETWADSYTKLLAFNLTSLDRVLALDSDSLVLQNLDELFLFQPAPIAMPYVYWGSPTGWSFSSQMMLITPSATAFSQIESAIKGAKADEYDMDILNTLFRNRILRIPQRPYNLLSGEFRRAEHKQYLGPASQRAYAKPWDPDAVLAEARFLHFSDWPVPKPWMRASQEVLNKYMPKCRKSEWFGASNCRDRAVWLKLYVDFAVRRKTVCGVGFELQSQVLPPDSVYRHGRWFHPDEVG